VGTVQMREESESGIRKCEETSLKTTAEDGERGAAVTCDGRLFHRRAAATVLNNFINSLFMCKC